MKYSKDGKVVFNTDNHTYYLGDKRLKSVTTYINEFKNEFDSDTIAERYAKKNGLVKEDVLAEWKQKADISRDKGIACHTMFEDYILKGEINYLGISEKEIIVNRFINAYFKTGRLIPIETEYIVYGDELAGQVDCIAINKEGEYFILDWKTNKSIDYESFNKYMLHPYSQYPDASFYHYSLQLSLYKKLCKEYHIKDCYIVHLGDQEFKLIKIKLI